MALEMDQRAWHPGRKLHTETMSRGKNGVVKK